MVVTIICNLLYRNYESRQLQKLPRYNVLIVFIFQPEMTLFQLRSVGRLQVALMFVSQFLDDHSTDLQKFDSFWKVLGVIRASYYVA